MRPLFLNLFLILIRLNFYLLFKDLFFKIGGAKRDRTADLLRAKQALSQLSYSPKFYMVGLNGLEPSTSRLSGVRSNQLSYRPMFYLKNFSVFQNYIRLINIYFILWCT